MLGRNTLAGFDARAFTALLDQNDQQHDDALSLLQSRLAGPDVRVIRFGSPSRTHAMLESILAPVTAPDSERSVAERARLITRTIAARRGQETRVLLLITQAEELHPKVLRALQAMTPYFAQHDEPTLQVLFMGRPSFRTLLIGKDLAPLREALGTEPGLPLVPRVERVDPASLKRPFETLAAGKAEQITPMPAARAVSRQAGLRRGRLLILILLGIAVVVMLLVGGALGLRRLFYRDVPMLPARTPAASATVPTSLSPPALPDGPTPPSAEALADEDARVRQSFDDFLTSTGRNAAAPLEPPRETPPQQPESRRNPRIVIHVPAGSMAAEALSARLVTNLRTRSGTIEARRVPDTPNRPSIRYFHPEDEPAARLAAAWMADAGLNWTLRDFSSFQPRPSRGTIEVWLPRQP